MPLPILQPIRIQAKIYRPTVRMRRYLAPLPALWGLSCLALAARWIQENADLSATPEKAALAFIALLALLLAGLSTYLATERIEIGPRSLVRGSLFGTQRILAEEILEIQRKSFGKGNSLLRLRTRKGTFRMALLFSDAELDRMVADVEGLRPKKP